MLPTPALQTHIRSFQPEDFADFLSIEQQSYRKEITFDRQKLYSFLGDENVVAFCLETLVEPTQVEPAHDKTTQDKPTQDKTTQDKTTQGEPTQDKPTQVEPTQVEPTHDKTTQDKTTQDKTTQDKTTQDKTTQDKTVQVESAGSESNKSMPTVKTVQVAQKKIVGTLLLKMQKFQNQLWLISLTVDPKYRRQGLGNLALNYAIQLATFLKSNEILLQVEKNNAPAIQLFQKHGFLVLKELEDFLLPNNLGLDMKKDLLKPA